MNEREFDLLRAAPALSREQSGAEKGRAPDAAPIAGERKTRSLRAINRAPPLIRKLYLAGLISPAAEDADGV
jgi:hypothetical protein